MNSHINFSITLQGTYHPLSWILIIYVCALSPLLACIALAFSVQFGSVKTHLYEFVFSHTYHITQICQIMDSSCLTFNFKWAKSS